MFLHSVALVVALSTGQIGVRNNGVDGGMAQQRIDCWGGLSCDVYNGSARITGAGSMTGPVTYYIATDGGDTRDCLSPAQACKSPEVVCAKFPHVVSYPINVQFADGGYDGGCVITSQVIPATTSGAAINFLGQLANYAPVSGTATGTFTAVTTTPNLIYSQVTDSTQGWTQDDLKGRFLVTTGGTGSGQTRVIRTNTATQIETVSQFSPTPDTSTTYAIRTPSVFFTGAGLNQPGGPPPNPTAAGTPSLFSVYGAQMHRYGASTLPAVQFTNVEFIPTGTGTRAITIENSDVNLLTTRVLAASTLAVMVGGGSRLSAVSNVLSSSVTSGYTISVGRQASRPAAAYLLSNLIQATGSSFSVGLGVNGPASITDGSNAYEVYGTSGAGVLVTSGTLNSTVFSSSVITCRGSAFQSAIANGGWSSGSVGFLFEQINGQSGGSSAVYSHRMQVENCGLGVGVWGRWAEMVVHGPWFIGNVLGLDVQRGGRYVFGGGGGTFEMTDGGDNTGSDGGVNIRVDYENFSFNDLTVIFGSYQSGSVNTNGRNSGYLNLQTGSQVYREPEL